MKEGIFVYCREGESFGESFGVQALTCALRTLLDSADKHPDRITLSPHEQ